MKSECRKFNRTDYVPTYTLYLASPATVFSPRRLCRFVVYILIASETNGKVDNRHHFLFSHHDVSSPPHDICNIAGYYRVGGLVNAFPLGYVLIPRPVLLVVGFFEVRGHQYGISIYEQRIEYRDRLLAVSIAFHT